jgi:carboxypeptidase C (cathepsin A)
MRLCDMYRIALVLVIGALVQGAPLRAADSSDSSKPSDASKGSDTSKEKHHRSDEKPPEHFKPEDQSSKGSVTVEGHHIDYDAHAGTLVVHPKDWDDVPQNAPPDEDKNPRPEASMFYVAYFKSTDKGSGDKGDKGANDKGTETSRPVTFIYNGGPGSATVWLHMGAFGPRRVVTSDDTHTPAAPYTVVNNEYSLLDASDLVFVDAPGTGFSRVAGKDREKAFYGIDPDAQAFADFIVQFLSKYGRWNSPKYLLGESYGTTRSAVLVNVLEQERYVDFNGVILLSQILAFDSSADAPQFNPGVDLPYELALPTYAATAWYHHKLPSQPAELAPLLIEVESFALNAYSQALNAGSSLSSTDRQAIAEKLHQYTGLPVDYILKADLRINGGEFEKTLEQDTDMTTGRLDTRFSGPTLDPLSKEAEYDPQSAAIGSAYVSSFNDYVRKELKYGQDKEYRPLALDVNGKWNLQHQAPGTDTPLQQSGNVMPDLSAAMKYNPDLHVLLNGGYFDLATPFFEGIYEMQHLMIPAALHKNIEFSFYESGHMVYAHTAALKEFHAHVADFIRRTSAPNSH